MFDRTSTGASNQNRKIKKPQTKSLRLIPELKSSLKGQSNLAVI